MPRKTLLSLHTPRDYHWSRLEFDFLEELKNLFIKIPLLQAMKDVPIYNKIVRDLRQKQLGRKLKILPLSTS